MSKIDSSNLVNAQSWLKKSSEAVLSHWHNENKTFVRNTNDLTGPFYTSASLHCIIALNNLGFWTKAVKKGNSIHTPYFEINSSNCPGSKELIEQFINIGSKVKQERDDESWIDILLANSSHVNTINNENQLRTSIVLELLLKSYYFLVKSLDSNIKEHEDDTNILIEKSKLLINEFLKEVFKYKPGETPSPILNVANCIINLINLIGSDTLEDEIAALQELLDGHINFHMGRSGTKSILWFDPISLATAVAGKVALDSEFINDPFFQSVLEVVIQSQHSNGCWPDGISITFSTTGDVVQQPSVGVAVAISEAAIHSSYLVDYNEKIENIINTVLPGLRKTAKFLEETYVEVKSGGSVIKGWSSDRIRKRNYSEAWITALVNRFFYRLWIAEKAIIRFQSLRKLGVKPFQSSSGQTFQSAQRSWEKTIIDPDIITKPTNTVWDKIIAPILKRKESSQIINRPNKNNVSFIIYGPPGSGKTFFVENMAKVIDWPLVELSPGHFIKNGLELIEATASEIFELVDNLNHAVVFFDECDELFRDRDIDKNTSTTRSILSFATASMLPKLQKLHDNRNVLFVLGTNYLKSIDKAIKRPGRFDYILLFDRPDDKARTEFFLRNLKKEADGVEVEGFISKTKFFTFQELGPFYANPSKEENTVEEYKKWAKETGKDEIKESGLRAEIRKLILDKWEVADEEFK